MRIVQIEVLLDINSFRHMLVHGGICRWSGVDVELLHVPRTVPSRPTHTA